MTESINIDDWSKEFTNSEGYDLYREKALQSPHNFNGDCLFLNFNYTDTDMYYKQGSIKNSFNSRFKNIETIRIHGNIKEPENPIIFGYGDELDQAYSDLENYDDNHYLENIKSIKYSETSNYSNLLKFIYSNYYEVYVLGHSCGLSDRTLLNMLFENDNCVSIKVVYKTFENGTDNFSDIVRNISRSFTNKQKMRDRVVDKTSCPQF